MGVITDFRQEIAVSADALNSKDKTTFSSVKTSRKTVWLMWTQHEEKLLYGDLLENMKKKQQSIGRNMFVDGVD